MDSAELARRENEAATRHLVKRVFPLFDVKNKIHLGTASLFQRGEHHFIVSAHHVLEPIHEASERERSTKHIRMPAAPPESAESPVDLVPLGSGELIRTPKVPRDFGDDDYREDVAVFRLRPENAERMKKAGWVFLTDADVFRGECDECVIFGWPQYDITALPDPGLHLAGMPNQFRLYAMAPPVADPLPTDFFLKYSDEFPHLRGVSGSPVWAYIEHAPGAVWHGGQKIKLVGVQHAMATDKAYVRATLWAMVSHMVDDLVKRGAGVPDETERG